MYSTSVNWRCNTRGKMIKKKYHSLIIILAFVICYIVTIRVLLASDWPKFVGAMLVFIIPVAGKEAIIPLSIYLGINVPIVFTTIILIDVITGLIVVYNWWVVDWLIQKSSFANKYYIKVQNRAEKLSSKKRFVLYGILLLIMMIPIYGGGAGTVAAIGKILNLSNKKTISIIFIGTFTAMIIITTVPLGIISLI
jgi:uncharacterized membrane protein